MQRQVQLPELACNSPQVCSGCFLPLPEYTALPRLLQTVFPEEEEGGGGAAERLEVLQKTAKGLRFGSLLWNVLSQACPRASTFVFDQIHSGFDRLISKIRSQKLRSHYLRQQAAAITVQRHVCTSA